MRRIAVALCAVSLVGLTSGTAFAGEVTGNGKSLEPLKGRSICAYSGLNDNPAGSPTDGPGGRTQSFGQDVRGGFIDPRQFNPGDACNPNIVFGE